MSATNNIITDRLMESMETGLNKFSNYDFKASAETSSGSHGSILEKVSNKVRNLMRLENPNGSLSKKVPAQIRNGMRHTFFAVDRIGQELGALFGRIVSFNGSTRAAFRLAGIVAGIAAAAGVGAVGFSLAALAKITMESAKAIKAASVYTYNNVLTPVGLAIANVATAAFAGIVVAKDAVVKSSKWLWTNALKPAGEAVATGAVIAGGAILKAGNYTPVALSALAAGAYTVGYGLVSGLYNIFTAPAVVSAVNAAKGEGSMTIFKHVVEDKGFKATRDFIDKVKVADLSKYTITSGWDKLVCPFRWIEI